MSSYTHVIVGAGSAGCVLAYRLSQNPALRILLLEAGGPDRHPYLHMPKGIAKAMSDPAFIWPYLTQAQPTTNGVTESWARGRVLGGSSSINGMMYVRGQAADFDALATMTGDQWGWEQIGPAYRAMECHELGSAPSRGDRGPLRLSMPEPSALMDAVVAAGEALGLTKLQDVNSPEDIERIGYTPRTIHGGRRQSAAVAFLRPAQHRSNLTILTGVTVDRLVVGSGRVITVEAIREGRSERYQAQREVILSAGALSSPAILQRSGIGPRNGLNRVGVQVVHNSPEVGANLIEHRGMVMQWRVRDRASQNREFRGARLALNTFRYALSRKGPMANAAYEAGAWLKSHPQAERPDGQILMAPFTFDYSSPTFGVEAHGGMNFCVYPLRPRSRGQLLIASSNPIKLPVITANYNADGSDREVMRGLIRFARRCVETSPLADLVQMETRPGSTYQSDDELAAAHDRYGYGSYHASGTCRMGRDDASVVDPNLRVRGIEGVRVVDTSIFPFMLSGNVNGPAMVTAWRAADLILEDAA